jgi:hypothetical protein
VSAKEYWDAFDTFYYKRYNQNEIETHLPLSGLKRWSLNMLDYMGFLDFDYKSGKIVVNPPQLIAIPTNIGRRMILIGGRSPRLIDNLWTATQEANFNFYSITQHESISTFLLPNTIIVEGFGKKNELEVDKKMQLISDKCGIKYMPNEFPQFALAEFSGSLNEYKSNLKADENFNDQGWNVKLFNPFYLQFIREESHQFDKTLALVEYKLNEHKYIHKLWVNGLAHNIDKSWGRFIILQHNNKHVIVNDRKKAIIAIPASLPLPRLISEAMTLFSGEAPSRERHNINNYNGWYSIYKNVPHIFAYNFFKKVGQNIIELNI